MHLVLYHPDIDIYQYERHMQDTENSWSVATPKILYNQRNKNETIFSVIKRLFGEYITSRLVRTQNRELSFRCIAYNMHRLTNPIIIIDNFYWAIDLLYF